MTKNREYLGLLQKELNKIKITAHPDADELWDVIIAMQVILNDAFNAEFKASEPDPFS